MKRIRKCSDICHRAKGTRCKCVCGGFFHGSKGAANREALALAQEPGLLEEHGIKKGEAAYIEQKELPLEAGTPRGKESKK